jgi:hypothetical protein
MAQDLNRATNLPQGEKDRSREWRIHAGYSGVVFCGKNRQMARFLSVLFR